MKTACVLMASGLSRRFGSDKLMADFGGEPLIARAVKATEGLFDVRIVVTRSAAAAAWAKTHGLAVLFHAEPDRADAIRLGLALTDTADGVLFCPCDQPLLRRETVAALRDGFAAAPQCIWRPAFDGVPGAPVLFPRWAYPELTALQKGGGRAVLARHPDSVRTVLAQSAAELSDADTPEALAALARTLKNR